MENVKVWTDEDGVVHLGVDRPGERAVSTRVDPAAVIQALAKEAGLTVEIRAAHEGEPEDAGLHENPDDPSDETE